MEVFIRFYNCNLLLLISIVVTPNCCAMFISQPQPRDTCVSVFASFVLIFYFSYDYRIEVRDAEIAGH